MANRDSLMKHQGKKALFFDIDGTLWDRYNYIPRSTRDTIKKLKENGHMVFINSGRARGFIFNDDLLSLDFDGIVSACGTMIEYENEVLYYRPLAKELIKWSLEVCKKYGFSPIFEGPEYLYMNKEDFPFDAYAEKLAHELGWRLRRLDDKEGELEASKFSIACGVPEREKGFNELREHFNIISHTPDVAEVVPIGFDKGTGIIKTCELLNIDIKDTYAFGDSGNDIEMLKTVGTGICMGSGYQVAMDAADYTTDGLMENGIRNACIKFGLI